MPDAPATAIASGTEALVRSYNDVPYTSSPNPSRHPDRLATIGTLLGLDVAPIATARVLELACGDGSNLVALGLLGSALIIGGAIGATLARRVEMTGMPELVAILHSFVGLAAVLVGFASYLSPEAQAKTQ